MWYFSKNCLTEILESFCQAQPQQASSSRAKLSFIPNFSTQYVAEAPVYVAEAPAYVAEAPAYVAEAPVYVAEAPVYVAEAPPGKKWILKF